MSTSELPVHSALRVPFPASAAIVNAEGLLKPHVMEYRPHCVSIVNTHHYVSNYCTPTVILGHFLSLAPFAGGVSVIVRILAGRRSRVSCALPHHDRSCRTTIDCDMSEISSRRSRNARLTLDGAGAEIIEIDHLAFALAYLRSGNIGGVDGVC